MDFTLQTFLLTRNVILFLSVFSILTHLNSSSPTEIRHKRIVSEAENDINSISEIQISEAEDLAPYALANDQPKTTPDGDYIFEGDIVIPKEFARNSTDESDGLEGRTAVAEPVLYWPGGVVVYSYHQCKFP